ncbi:putative lipid II flippase FtsW [Sanguibacter sp. HDW7]|uniref:putative lipid II flippase FtsW n=1 Tax=Sanguibacter sp. HDW7 TaxID=2714931 RepID=UPI001408EFAF|nr:putative lipid II flippase FtsW [Sanguibacter sp. HDW7]QIK83310.1 putative lipid II flippase FtsW [Sanguibacter sp. HDW7]
MTANETAGRTDAAPTRRRSLLGSWDTPVTSYYLVLGLTVLLVVFGLAMVLSASSVRSITREGNAYSIFLGQAVYAVLGVVALTVTASMRPIVYKKLAWIILAASLALQALIFVPSLSVSALGNTNWIKIPGTTFTIQPSEIVKLALAVWLAAVLARKGELLRQWWHVIVPAVPVAAVAILLVLSGHDLGTAIILMLLVAGALWVAGVPMRMFAVGGGLMAAGIAAMILLQTNKNRLGRIDAWLGRDCGVGDACYQTKHGLWALGTGGWTGVGLGAGREKWHYLPEAHNDFIFAVVGEELGLQGTILMLLLFGALAWAMSRIVVRHPDPFVKIATGAIMCWIIGQALVNIGVVIGALPVIGIPLPLVSAGGSALIMTMAAMGVVLSFARDEPGAREAFAARAGVVRRSLAVVGGSVRRSRKGRSTRA